MSNHVMPTSSSEPQPDGQQNAENSNISHTPEGTTPRTPTTRQALQDALDGTVPTTSGPANEREMPQDSLQGARFTVHGSAQHQMSQDPLLGATFTVRGSAQHQMPQDPLLGATFTVPGSAQQRQTPQCHFHNTPGFPYFSLPRYTWHNPTGCTCFPVVQTPTANAIQPAGSFFFALAFLPVVPIGICHQIPPTTIQSEMPAYSNQLYRSSDPIQFRNGPDEMSRLTDVLPQEMTQGPRSNVSASTHRGQSHLRAFRPMGSQISEDTSVPHAGISARASGGRAPNVSANDFPHSLYSNGGIPLTPDFDRISQDRDLGDLSATQYRGIRQPTHFGQHRGNTLASTDSFRPASSRLESTHLNQQRNEFSASTNPNNNMSPTTYFGQHLGNVSSIIDSNQRPYSPFNFTAPNFMISGSSGRFTPNNFASPGTHISQRPGDISSTTSYLNPTELNDLAHQILQSYHLPGFDIQNSGTRSHISQRPGDNSSTTSYLNPTELNDLAHQILQSYHSPGFDIQNSGTRSTHNTRMNATNVGNSLTTNFNGREGEVSSVAEPMDYSIFSMTSPYQAFSNWAPRTTSTPFSADHMNAASGRSIPSHSPMRTGARVLFAPNEVLSSGSERMVAAGTLPSEVVREGELRDELTCERANSETCRQKMKLTTEGKCWCLYLIKKDVIIVEMFIKDRC
jgi:hypothetical protein